jgi:trypsin
MSPRRARAAIVGGKLISIGDAPWQVAVVVRLPGKEPPILCGGSILDSERVLTAAHCTFGGEPGEETPIPAGDFEVIAGASELGEEGGTVQARKVANVRVHPYFNLASGITGGDDVAVLELSEKLTLEPLQAGSAVAAIPPVAAGATPPEGAQVNLTGFGSESEQKALPDGKLYSLAMTLGFSRSCGGEANALFLCASVGGGTACHGDSGSGLTVGGSTPTLVGVTDFLIVTGETEYCPAGISDGFVDLAAPEIRDFIEGSEAPPHAPRGGGASISGMPVVGSSLSCQPGSWSEHPAFSFAFIDSASGRVLRSGPPSTYPLSEADVGRAILCEVWAANAGGTGIGRTEALPPIVPAPLAAQPPANALTAPAIAGEGAKLSTIGTSISVTGGAAIVKVACRARVRCGGKLTLTAERAARRGRRRIRSIVSIGSASVSIAANRTSTVRIQLVPVGRALLRSARGRLRAHLLIVQLQPAGAGPVLESVQLVRRARK